MMPLESSGFSVASASAEESEREIDLEPLGSSYHPSSYNAHFPQPYVPVASSRHDRGYPYAV
jgi:hypothetical protein